MPNLPKMRTVLALSIWALFAPVAASPGLAKEQSSAAAEVFSETAASQLLSQLAEGLRAHSSHQMLSVFDLTRMEGAPLFKQQITAFFNQYESIRIHFKLLDVKQKTVTVNAELDATPPDGINPAQHRNVQLRFTAEKTQAGWKFIDIQPRDFFS